MNEALKIEELDLGGKKILRLEGRLDAASTPSLEKRIEELLISKEKKVLLDFAKVNYLSSAGIRILLSATKKWKAFDGKILFFSMSTELMELIKIAGFDRILSIYPNEKEALLALNA